MITFTPLSGAAGSSRTVPLAYILQVDDVRILLDCGSPDWCPESSGTNQDSLWPWDKYCEALKEYAPTVDLVLLSHGDLAHSGLYAYAHTHWNLTAPAYTTLPVQAMARIAATEDAEGIRDEQDVGDKNVKPPSPAPEGYDYSSSTPSSPTPKSQPRTGKYVPTVQEVHEAFDSVNVLRYTQPCHLQGKCQGLTIIPFNAGHTLGGTIWKIRSPTAGTILYAVDMNHMREHHLDGTVLVRGASAGGGVFESLARPDLLITDAERANVITARRKDRIAALLDCVTATLTSRNSLLMPCDSSTRVLELLVLLDQHWNYSRLKYPICLLSRTGREMLTFVRSMMEWLGTGNAGRGGKRRRADDDADEDALGAFALRFRHLEFFPNPQALLHTYSSKDPKLILAVPASLSHGPSRALFSQFAETPDNVVLLTGRSEEGTLGRVLFDRWNDAQRDDTKWDRGKIGSNVMMDGSIRLTVTTYFLLPARVLTTYADERQGFLQKERAVKEKEAAQKAAMARTQRILEADEGEDESEKTSGAHPREELMDTKEDAGSQNGLESRTKRKGTKSGAADATDWGLGLDADEAQARTLSFDIYLKGNVSRTTSFFKSEGQTQRFEWEVLEEDAESEEVKQLKKKTEEEAKKVPVEPPSKYVTTEVEVQLACRLLYVDLEGLNDGRAVKTIVPQVNPRKMIIGIQIGQHTNSFSISLSDELLDSIKMSQFEDNEVGYVTGRIASLASSTIPVLEPVSAVSPTTASVRKAARGRMLGSRPAITLPQSTMIGELKLTALKTRLAAVGVQAELIQKGSSADALEDSVTVKKTTRAGSNWKGPCPIYYVVRREIYNLHALVAA
ncbi:beta-lactamase-like protein [Amylocystis lapponica]|nr:beta-lactamase-like protein [Amylocystis lapponica]